MFVYGIRCAPADLTYLPDSAEADYYIDYGLLVFPRFTRAGTVVAPAANPTGLNNTFWKAVKLLAEQPSRPHMVAVATHPQLSQSECKVLVEIQRAFPLTTPAWFNVPRVATNQERAVNAEDC
jgi:hypothetical protein